MRVAIRTDASVEMGGGHVMRCLTLAHEMARRGSHVTFLCRPGTAETIGALARSGFAVITVGDTVAGMLDALHRLYRDGVDLLIVDSYAIAAPQHRMLRSCARIILVIDDLADRPHDCDLLLDQTLGREPSSYETLVPSSCRVLAGAKYALLRPEFAAARPRALARRAGSRGGSRILVSLGMTDIGGITGKVVRALLGAQPNGVLDVVLDSRAESRAEVVALAASAHNVHVHTDPESMAALMLEADLAVGAAGSTSWERCCLGLPTVTVVLAENQNLIAENLARQGAILNVSSTAAPIEESLAAAVVQIAFDHQLRRAMSNAAFGVTDGLGAKRVAEATMEACHQRFLSSVPP
jgi:UDP-2,4-diacetamido-2,4,6-trideoxy-beta-L-altropyranose hydrolase